MKLLTYPRTWFSLVRRRQPCRETIDQLVEITERGEQAVCDNRYVDYVEKQAVSSLFILFTEF